MSMKENMRIPDMCARCLYDMQAARVKDPDFLARVRDMLDHRDPRDTAPYMVYRFAREYERRFGPSRRYDEDKRRYNDMVLAMEGDIRQRIMSAPDPLSRALAYARAGNYIDFGAMEKVDPEAFLALLDQAEWTQRDMPAYRAFLDKCRHARRFLLLCDNCGEIVLDKLFLEELGRRFPHIEIWAMVRGGEALNDATEEDARYVGLDRIAHVIGNGAAVAGTVYAMLPEAARRAVDSADVILSKGQGNYESFSGDGREAFYAFLCKCDLFTQRFGVPRFTGMLIHET